MSVTQSCLHTQLSTVYLLKTSARPHRAVCTAPPQDDITERGAEERRAQWAPVSHGYFWLRRQRLHTRFMDFRLLVCFAGFWMITSYFVKSLATTMDTDSGHRCLECRQTKILRNYFFFLLSHFPSVFCLVLLILSFLSAVTIRSSANILN